MGALLYLVHRIPYPPNKGDKIRSYNILKYLARKYEIYLGAFIDHPDDWKYQKDLQKYCKDLYLCQLSSRVAKLRSAQGFLKGTALTVPYYYNRGMSHWVSQVISQRHISKILVFSSAMAQYVQGEEYSDLTRILDLVDIDSDKWYQYSQNKTGIMKGIYLRESKRLFEYECEIVREFDVSLFVSQPEADCFIRRTPELSAKVGYFNNGVNADFFDPLLEYVDPYCANRHVLLFTGAMDYWANIDAVVWFSKHVWPRILKLFKDAVFYIVGSNPDSHVLGLNNAEGVFVTGRVDDVRPYLAYASLSVAPMRIARGIQNKVLEALAMGLPVAATKQAAEGISANPEDGLLVSDNTDDMVKNIAAVLQGDKNQHGARSRKFIKTKFNWDRNLEKLSGYLEGF